MMSFLLAALAAAHPPVVVSSLETRQLVEYCHGSDIDRTYNFCSGYIMAEFDTLSLSHQICPSVNDSSIRAIARTRKYLNRHREKWGSAPSFVVRDALRASFPCKRK